MLKAAATGFFKTNKTASLFLPQSNISSDVHEHLFEEME